MITEVCINKVSTKSLKSDSIIYNSPPPIVKQSHPDRLTVKYEFNINCFNIYKDNKDKNVLNNIYQKKQK